jgi:hypothetical protein
MPDEPEDYWGPERLHIAEPVANVIGPDALARIRSDPAWRTRDCWVCRKDADGTAEPIGLAVTVERDGALQTPRIVHTRCAPSAVYEGEATADPAADEGHPGRAGDTDMRAHALNWPPGSERLGALLLVDFGVEFSYTAENGDLVDGIAQHLAEKGWELVTRRDTLPSATPEGTAAVWQIIGGSSEYGHLVIAGPGALGQPQLIVDMDLIVPDLWTAAALYDHHIVALLGPFGIDDDWADGADLDAVRRAVSAGRVMGAVIPTAVRMPNGQPFPPFNP